MKCYLCNNPDTTKVLIGKCEAFKCGKCDLLFVPDYGNEKAFYKTYFDSQRLSDEKMNSLRQQQYVTDANHFNRFMPKGSVLDIGCSRGYFIDTISKKGKYKRLTGIDIDSSSIKYAQENLGSSKMDFFDDTFVSFKVNKKYNAIVFRGTFEYMGPDLQAVCNKLKSSLKKNGLVFIYSLHNADSFMFYLLKDAWNLFNPAEHKLHFTRKAVEYMCEAFGFEIVEFSYPYLETAYADMARDYETVIDDIKNGKQLNSPFWGNMMQIVLKAKA